MEPPRIYQLKNRGMILTLGVQDDRLIHTALVNRFTHRSYFVWGEEFQIELRSRILGPQDFKVTEVEQEPQRLVFHLLSEKPPARLELSYWTEPDQWFIRKQLQFIPSASGVFLERITLQKFTPWQRPETFSGPGQPVYVGDFFLGVEYPASRNRAEKEQVVCAYAVGLKVGQEGYLSQSSVIGAAEAGATAEGFLAYLDRVRSYPVRPFLLYNTWYDLRNYSDQELIQLLARFPADFPLQSVVLDDGWDDFRRLWSPHPKRFPNGLEPVRSAAESLHQAHLGLWMSPLGGYLPNQLRRLLSSAGQGFEKGPLGFCLGGPNYQARFLERMLFYQRKQGVNYFKLDNLPRHCPYRHHGHRVGSFGQVGLTDAVLQVLDAVKKENPAVMLNITVGAWLSPWWLLHCDVVWSGGLDHGAKGAGSGRQQSITYRDAVLYQRLAVEQAQFPIHSLMTHGIIKGRLEDLGDEGENLRDFSDDVIMFFGRGVMMWELYCTPASLSSREWRFLQEAIAWARQNADLLKNSRRVLGNPAQGQVYGYAHRAGKQGLLVVRNPAEKEQSLDLDWSTLLGPGWAEISSAQFVYASAEGWSERPLSDWGRITLPGLSVAVIKVNAP